MGGGRLKSLWCASTPLCFDIYKFLENYISFFGIFLDSIKPAILVAASHCPVQQGHASFFTVLYHNFVYNFLSIHYFF